MIGAWEESLNQILLKFGVIEKPLQSNAAEELESTLQDYHNLQQYGDMLTKYCYGKKPIMENGVWLCPDCGRCIQFKHSYCHWCGRKMGWEGFEEKGVV